MFILVMAVENVLDLFKSVVNLFLKVSFSKLEDIFLHFWKKKRGKACEKRLCKSKKRQWSFQHEILEILEDKSVNKQDLF